MTTRPTHPELVQALAKPGLEILHSMSAKDAHLMHMAMGIAGEAGEIIDAVKKAVIYRKELDRENLIEELGDVQFFCEGIAQSIGVTLEECREKNIDKLLVRYGTTYSDKAAQERKDKVGE